jgi:hypothetical protein
MMLALKSGARLDPCSIANFGLEMAATGNSRELSVGIEVGTGTGKSIGPLYFEGNQA